MRALMVWPGRADSLEPAEVDESDRTAGQLLVEGFAVGVCGAAGEHGTAPPSADRLILGHESLGRVLDAPPERGFAVGNLVAGAVRHPDPVPCDGSHGSSSGGNGTGEAGGSGCCLGVSPVTRRTRILPQSQIELSKPTSFQSTSEVLSTSADSSYVAVVSVLSR